MFRWNENSTVHCLFHYIKYFKGSPLNSDYYKEQFQSNEKKKHFRIQTLQRLPLTLPKRQDTSIDQPNNFRRRVSGTRCSTNYGRKRLYPVTLMYTRFRLVPQDKTTTEDRKRGTRLALPRASLQMYVYRSARTRRYLTL